jgi:hypothetical protein
MITLNENEEITEEVFDSILGAHSCIKHRMYAFPQGCQCCFDEEL